MLLRRNQHYYLIHTTKNIYFFIFFSIIIKLLKRGKNEKGYYESVAKEILMLNELKSAYLPCSMQLEKAVSLSNEFYKNFFNQKRNKKIDKLNESTIYNRCNQMKTYQGISANGTQKSLIILPAYDNARLAITTTHEKAHTFQDTRQKNEIIPSFLK